MRSAFFFAMGLFAVACGGRGALEAYDFDGSGGEGGSGGAPVTSTTITSTSVSVSTTTVSSVGPTTTVTSVTTGPGFCDNTGDCGSCFECSSQGGKCTDSWNVCFQTPSCIQMIDCINMCPQGDLFVCFQSCAMGNPEGAEILAVAIGCTFCDECMNDCGPFAGGFCG